MDMPSYEYTETDRSIFKICPRPYNLLYFHYCHYISKLLQCALKFLYFCLSLPAFLPQNISQNKFKSGVFTNKFPKYYQTSLIPLLTLL